MVLLNALILIAFASYSSALDFPAGVTICGKSDAECIKKAFKSLVTIFAKGSKEFGMPQIDPFVFKEARIAGNGGPVDLLQIYHNVRLHGISQMDLDEIKITEQGAEIQFDCVAHVKQLIMLANYEAKGKMLLLEINGGGASNLTMEDYTVSVKILAERITKNGEEFLHRKQSKTEVLSAHLIIDYENMVNNNPELSKVVVDTMNQNERDMYNFLKEDYENAFFSVAFNTIADVIFSKIPLKKLFKD